MNLDELLTDLEAKAKVVDMKSMGAERSIAYIAACEPIVIIALIARLKRYREALKAISMPANEFRKIPNSSGSFYRAALIAEEALQEPEVK